MNESNKLENTSIISIIVNHNGAVIKVKAIAIDKDYNGF